MRACKPGIEVRVGDLPAEARGEAPVPRRTWQAKGTMATSLGDPASQAAPLGWAEERAQIVLQSCKEVTSTLNSILGESWGRGSAIREPTQLHQKPKTA